MRSIRTVSPIEVSRQLMAILATPQTTEFAHLLSPDAFMQIWSGNIRQTYKSRPQVCEGLVTQTGNWPNKPFLDVQCWDVHGDSVTVQFDIWDRPNGRILKTNYALSITLQEDKIKIIKLYQGDPWSLQPTVFADQQYAA